MAVNSSLDTQAPRPTALWGALPWIGAAMPSHRAFRVWQRNRDVYLQLWRVNVLTPLAEPVITILVMGLGLGTYVELADDQDYIQFVAPGVLAVFPIFAGMMESLWGAHFRLTQHGTYDAILATPARPEDIAEGEVLWAATHSTINAALILVIMAIFTPVYDLISSPLAILVLPVAFLISFIFSNLALAFTATTTVMSQLMYFFTLVMIPMFWFSGIFFPLDQLPEWAQTIAWTMPLTHTVDIFRALVAGNPGWGELGDLVWLLVVATATFWIPLRLMRRRLLV